MKKLLTNKWTRMGLGLLVMALLFIAGHHNEAGASGLITAEAAAVIADDTLSESEMKVVNALKKVLKQQQEDALKGYMTAEQLETQLKALTDGLKEKELKELEDIIANQGTIINQMKDANGGSEAKGTFREELRKALLANADAIKEVAAKNSGVVKLEVNKAATTVTTTAFGAGVIRGLRETEIDRRVMRERTLMDVITIINGGPDSDPLSWLERRPKEGGAAFITEGTAKPYVDHTWTEGKVSAEFIAVATPVSRKALTVMSLLESEINDILNEELLDALEEYMLRNSGASALVNSVWSYAKAFTGASLALAVDGANEFDVLRAAILQARKGNPSDAKSSGRMPNRIYISLDMQAKMDLIKDTQGRYLLPPFMSPDGMRIAECRSTKFLGADELW